MKKAIGLLGFGLLAATSLATTAAAAMDCSENSDCPKGFTCETSILEACPDLPPCADGEECSEPPDCEATEVSACVSIDCTSDSDCADDMACETVEQGGCGMTEPAPGGAGEDDGASDSGDSSEPAPADPDSEERPLPEEACTTESRNYCVPRYVLPCEADADCGPGFSCEAPAQSEPSDGGGSTPGDDAGSDDAAPPPEDGAGEDSDERPAGDPAEDPALPAEDEPMQSPSSCQLEIVGCEVNSDCPSGFTCEDNRDGSCTMSSDGETVCDTPDPAKVCTPPYADLGGGVPVRGADEGSGGPLVDGESEEDGAEAPAAPADADDNDASSKDSGGGCALVASGSAPSSPWWALGALFGAVALRRRGLGR